MSPSPCSVLSALALAALTGCAQVDSTGLYTTTDAVDGAMQPPDAAQADVAQSAPVDFAVSSASDLASPTMTSDMATTIQVCDVHKIKVNEVATQGANGAGDEFIELYNPCAGQVSMSGATLVYRSYNGTTDTPALWTFTTETIAPSGFFVVANMAFAGTANAKPFKYGSSGALASTGGGVGLRDASNVLIDSVGWGTATNAFVETTPVGAPSASQSAARTKDGVDTNNNLADFSLGTPTPGASN